MPTPRACGEWETGAESAVANDANAGPGDAPAPISSHPRNGTEGNGLKFVAAPTTLDHQEDRIRTVLGIGEGALPLVGRKAMQKYYEHLTINLMFPFHACYPEAISLHEEVMRTVTVVELFDPSKNLDCDSLGLVCRACRRKQEVELPLASLEVDEDHPNHQLIEDYWYWFWNWR
jgi:hypothetical protein